MNEENERAFKISKKLFEKISGISISNISINEDCILYEKYDYMWDMQIDEFFCKCLEYTFTEDYTLYFHKWSGVEENEFYFQCMDVKSGLQFSTERNYKQALFSACEEIMKTKKHMEKNDDNKTILI